MVVAANPFCPISLGFIGLLGAVFSRRTTFLGPARSFNGRKALEEEEEREDLLDQDDKDCDELSEDRIANFLESQKEQYYKSMGMAPPKQIKAFETSTNHAESMIEFQSSRETSYLDDGEESSLLALNAGSSRETTPEPRMYELNDSEIYSTVPAKLSGEMLVDEEPFQGEVLE